MNKLLLLCLTGLPLFTASVGAAELNGFELQSKTLDTQFVLKIDQPSDAKEIPGATDHRSISDSGWQDKELVLGIVVNSQAHAYSLTTLFHDPIVNDTVDGIPVVVAFCTLCGTGTVYDREVRGKTLTFGNSGLLYRADELFYDQQTRSLWSPFLNAAVSGTSEGLELAVVPSQITYWAEWKKSHPATTASIRSVSHESAGDVHLHAEERIAVRHGYHPKTPTLGLSWADGDAIAFTASEILEAGGQVSEEIAGSTVSVSFDSASQQFNLDSKVKHTVFRGSWSDWKKKFPKGRWYTSSHSNN